ncbi:MAG: hypothetical protein FRX49_06466 [Trebouxia sp. A1-2]|nr:MAG: hypothetical protein FRX49_06466 [Trebouxia sp. A1-2]
MHSRTKHLEQRKKVNPCHPVKDAFSSNRHILLQDLPGKVICSSPSVDQGQIECRLLTQSSFIWQHGRADYLGEAVTGKQHQGEAGRVFSTKKAFRWLWNSGKEDTENLLSSQCGTSIQLLDMLVEDERLHDDDQKEDRSNRSAEAMLRADAADATQMRRNFRFSQQAVRLQPGCPADDEGELASWRSLDPQVAQLPAV